MITQAIILAGGSGTRLSPLTDIVSKQRLPVYDKPMLFYPISLLLKAGLKKLLIVCKSKDLNLYGQMLSPILPYVNITYVIQDVPRGIAEAFLLCEQYIKNEPVALILGDNLFHHFNEIETECKNCTPTFGARIFGKAVCNPQDYGVAVLNQKGQVERIVEKPKEYISNLAVPGVYFYDASVVGKAKTLKPSKRGEYEITDINNLYLQEGNLNLTVLGDDVAWFDTGSFDSLFEATMYVKSVQSRTGSVIGLPLEAAYQSSIISLAQLEESTRSATPHNIYLRKKYGLV